MCPGMANKREVAIPDSVSATFLYSSRVETCVPIKSLENIVKIPYIRATWIIKIKTQQLANFMAYEIEGFNVAFTRTFKITAILNQIDLIPVLIPIFFLEFILILTSHLKLGRLRVLLNTMFLHRWEDFS